MVLRAGKPTVCLAVFGCKTCSLSPADEDKIEVCL